MIKWRTESTAIGASNSECWDTTLDESDVIQFCIRLSLFFRSIGWDISSMTLSPYWKATSKPSEIWDGWMPLSNKFEHACRKVPAITTTVVVPSPASTSWAFDISTS